MCVGYFASILPLPKSQCGSCGVQASIAHPINAATGAMYDVLVDVVATPHTVDFRRFYNSTNDAGGKLSSGWENSYSRNVVTRFSTLLSETYLRSANASSQYGDPATACISGFNEIKSTIPRWGDALASYSNGNCVLTKNGTFIGVAQVKASAGLIEPSSAPVAYDAIRDDGQLIRFIVDANGAIINPPGTSLKLQNTISGFTVIDGNDNVEQYDVNGKLLSVTSRAGVAQTMSYDGSGRLSGVTDSFGHQLIFNYDDQGRLSSVAKE
jgi:YD repeat-containing protein